MEMSWAQVLVKILLCFLMVLIDMQGSKACLETERKALLEIRNFYRPSVFPPSWSFDEREANCCGWERVRCNHTTGRVTHLILDNIFEAFDNVNHFPINFSLLHPLEQLQYLDLSDNHFVGLVDPKVLCGFKNLQELDISSNYIESLPECMGNLTSLRVLDLSSNPMTGNMPSIITSLNSLEYISLFDTNIEGIFSFSLLANHSKLEVFLLSATADNLSVETESPPWLPTFQLKALQLGSCNLNAIPGFLLHQHELRLIDLSHNKLQGEFPAWLLNNNSGLETLRLKNNSFARTLQLPAFTHSLLNLEISGNKFGDQLPENIGKIFPNLSHLNLAKNNFIGRLPFSMVEMEKIHTLVLSNNNFSGELGRHFFSNWKSLILLSLSHNNFSGKIIPKFANSARLQFLFLNNNNFSGEMDDGVLNKSSLRAMDISSNMVSGRIPEWIGNFEVLEFLSMSKNLLRGEVPIAICSLHFISYLELSENTLSGSLPDCLDNLTKLEFLHIQKNALKGYMPSISSNILYSIDLRDNKFYGEIPYTIDKYPYLRILLLGGNQLGGSIPKYLCNFDALRILDLSRNKFTGRIPSCLSKLQFFEYPCVYIVVDSSCFNHKRWVESVWSMLEIIIPLYNSTLLLNNDSLDSYYIINEPQPAEFRTKHNFYSYTGNILELMAGIDLSCNELSGSIPLEIGYLERVYALNLSHNRLTGIIPQSFSNLIKIESLDLSYNNLSGAIPPNLTALHSLAIFNVSYNNLSGPTPSTGQFANFDEDNYRGNPGLFGPFLNKTTPPSKVPSNERAENHKAIELVSFYWGFVSSYVTMILGLAIILWFSPRCCRVWFRFVDLCIYYCFPWLFKDGFR